MTSSDEAYSQRLTVKLGGVEMKLVRRPIFTPPPESTTAMLDNGTREAVGSRRKTAKFRNGKFGSLPFEPTHWTVPDER